MSRERLPPPAPLYLSRRYPSTPKGGTLLAEDVTSVEAHQRRLCNPDGYRPSYCPRCGCPRLHIHDYPERQLRSETMRCPIRLVRHRCAGCGAVWRILPAFLACVLRYTWSLIERTLLLDTPPPSLLPPPPPSSPPSAVPSAACQPQSQPPPLSALVPPLCSSTTEPLPPPWAPCAPAPSPSVPSPPPPAPSALPAASLPPPQTHGPPPLAPCPPSRCPASPSSPSSLGPSASTLRRWKARLAMSAAVLCQVLACSAAPALEHLAKTVGLGATRADLVSAYQVCHRPAKGQTLCELGALVHRLAPGVRLM